MNFGVNCDHMASNRALRASAKDLFKGTFIRKNGLVLPMKGAEDVSTNGFVAHLLCVGLLGARHLSR